MKYLKYAVLVATLAVLAACGQQQVPEAVQENVQPMSDLTSQALLTGSTSTPLSLNGQNCTSFPSVQLPVTWVVSGKQNSDASFTVNTIWTYNGTSFIGSSPQTVTVRAQENKATNNFPVTLTVVNGTTSGSGGTSFTVAPIITSNGGNKLTTTDSSNVTVNVAFDTCVAPNTRPTLVLPTSAVVHEADSALGKVVSSFPVTATDEEDGDLTSAVVCDPAPGSPFELGETPVNCSVSDSGSPALSASGSFMIRVQDTTAPDLTVPSAITAEATSASGAAVNFTGLSATDAVDANPSIACTADGNSVASGDTFPLGDTTVSCTASDAAGNTSAAKAFDITVRDTTAPTLSNMPTNINAVATSASGAVVTYTNPTATDTVDANPTVSCLPASGSTFGLGATTVSCTAKDASNNTSAPHTFSVTVAYGKSGILQPINPEGNSVFKFGSTVPVKFNLEGLSAGIIDATARITVAKQNSTLVSGWEDDTAGATTSAATTGNLFRYDSTSGQYIFNLNTKSLSTGTFRITIDLADGSPIQVLIGLRK